MLAIPTFLSVVTSLRGGGLMPAGTALDDKFVEQDSYLLQGHYMVPEVPPNQKGAKTSQP